MNCLPSQRSIHHPSNMNWWCHKKIYRDPIIFRIFSKNINDRNAMNQCYDYTKRCKTVSKHTLNQPFNDYKALSWFHSGKILKNPHKRRWEQFVCGQIHWNIINCRSHTRLPKYWKEQNNRTNPVPALYYDSIHIFYIIQLQLFCHQSNKKQPYKYNSTKHNSISFYSYFFLWRILYRLPGNNPIIIGLRHHT